MTGRADRAGPCQAVCQHYSTRTASVTDSAHAAAGHSAGQNIPFLVWNLKFRSLVYSNPPLDFVLGQFNPLKPELNSICYLLALLGAHHFLHVSRIRVKLLTFRQLMSYIYGAPILDVSRSHTTTQHSR